jgi:RND family efflux transporter MFP subunit
MKAAWAAAFFLACAAASVSYLAVRFRTNGRRAVAVQTSEPIPVKVAQARPAAAERPLQVSGFLPAEIEHPAITPFAATVKEQQCKEGDAVSVGSVVAVIESKELVERLRSREALLKRAHAALQESDNRFADAEKRLATMRELQRKDLIARRDVAEAEAVTETARAERDLARSQVEQREAALAQARYLQTLTRVTAPLSGVVTRRLVHAGDRVPAASALVTIASLTTLSLVLEIPPEADRLRPGAGVQISAEGLPTPFSGAVTRVRATGSPGNRRTAEVRVANHTGILKPGMKVSVSLPATGALDVVVVPSGAVFETDRRKYLYTVDGGKAQLKQVETVWEKDGEVAINAGLNAGEKVVISPRDRLQPNVAVRIIR